MSQIVGCTTVTDLGTDLENSQTLKVFREATDNPDFPIRLIQAHSPLQSIHNAEQTAVYLTQLSKTSTEKFRYGKVKLFTDGAIQGFTARLKWPGYYNGHSNGVWNTSPDQLKEQVIVYHKAGIHINVHCNGDEASEVFLDSVEAALEQTPKWDHRHTVQYSQMAYETQFRRMAKLGMCVNIFANHIYFWGDAHYSQTLGPERANRMDACNTAKGCGLHFSIHSDNPVTPIDPLFTAWCSVNRKTDSGRILGESERISVQDALYAVTLDAAYILKMEHEIGSIEVGKRADFCILEEDPLTIPIEMLKDVPVWGTLLGGKVFQAPKLK